MNTEEAKTIIKKFEDTNYYEYIKDILYIIDTGKKSEFENDYDHSLVMNKILN